MAKKSTRQELSELFSGGKKANVFYRGLNTDTDEHIIGNDQYVHAKNARLTNSETNFATLQNIKSDKVSGVLTYSVLKFEPNPDHGAGFPYDPISHYSWFDVPDQENDIPRTYVRIAIHLEDNETVYAVIRLNQPSSPYYDKVYPNGNSAKGKDMLGHILHELKENSTFSSKIAVSIRPGASPNDMGWLNFQSLTGSPIKNGFSGINIAWSMSTSTNIAGSSGANLSWENNITVGYTATTIEHTLLPLIAKDFGNYVAVLGTSIYSPDYYLQHVVKLYFNKSEDTLNRIILSVEGRFFEARNTIIVDGQAVDVIGDTPIKMVKVDENSKYRRIYFTDGREPVKSVNLEATASFYSGFDSDDDFNLFSKSPLTPIEVLGITDAGNVNCGSWSYCYKLLSGSGSGSVVSPISNPTPLFTTPTTTTYHTTVGDDIGDNSNKSIRLKISNIDSSYDKIQLIGIHYLDELGSAAFYLIKDEYIGAQEEMILTHNGNETTTSITAAEILTDANTWDVCQDLAVKDNRLFASNLSNSAFEIENGESAFRVKSYLHSGADSRVDDLSGSGSDTPNFDGVPAGHGSFDAQPGLNNPDIDDPLLYLYPWNDKTKYRYAEGPDSTSRTYFGASTPGFHDPGDINGIKVTFKLKQFRLDSHFNARVSNDTFGMTGRWTPWDTATTHGDDYFIQPPFFGPQSRGGEDGYWDNYQSPIFCHKYTGYQRGEVYRFGIQFYDKQGNSTFTYPIGDVRFPDVMADYRYNTDPLTDTGTHVAGGWTAVDGVTPPPQHELCSDEGLGQILHPVFSVKLKGTIRNKISGFSIVRAERNEGDETVRLNGLLHHTFEHVDNASEGDSRKRYSPPALALFNPNTDGVGWGTENSVVEHEICTFDSPDAILGKKDINGAGNKLMITGQLKPYCFPASAHPNEVSGDVQMQIDSSGQIQHYWASQGSNSQTDTIVYAYNHYPDITTVPRLNTLYEQSLIAKYYSDRANIILNDSSKAADGNYKYLFDIHYSQNVAPAEVISPSLVSTSHDSIGFINSGRQEQYSNAVWPNISSTNTWGIQMDGHGFQGNNTHYINLSSGSVIHYSSVSRRSDGSGGYDENHEELGYDGDKVHISSKFYAKIIRTGDFGRYGGNTKSVFEKQRWISTGTSIHGSDVKPSQNLDVFGGDTFVNYFSVNKKFELHTGYSNTADKAISGVIFPTESRINTEMRRGRYFGKDSAHLNLEDEYLYAKTYSASNNIKSFPAKDSSIPDINEFPQTIAVSNVKIAGQTKDSFSRFDANESYDVDANYGQINNLLKFRDELYAIQDSAVVKLDVNSKALIQDELGQQITIASGTGSVITDHQYLSTLYGSQNRMNTLVTEKTFYWLDHRYATICRLGATNRGLGVVEDLLESKSCMNLLSHTQGYTLFNRPLHIPSSFLLNTTNEFHNVGGIHMYYNPEFKEVGFSMMYYFTREDANSELESAYSPNHIIFNEQLDCFVTKLDTYIGTSFLHNGSLFKIGTYNLNLTSTGPNAPNIGFSSFYKRNMHVIDNHATGANSVGAYLGYQGQDFEVTFVNNEDISSIKIYDKLVASYDGTLSSNTFRIFTFKTNFHQHSILDPENFVRSTIGKQIWPIIAHASTGRMKGNYLKVKIISETTNQDINLWSFITHHRKTIV